VLETSWCVSISVIFYKVKMSISNLNTSLYKHNKQCCKCAGMLSDTE